MNDAAMLREMKLLRNITEAAIRLRRVGRSCDTIDEAMQEIRAQESPPQTRSATMLLMADEAFQTAMKNFDEAVLQAFDAGMEWATLPSLGPSNQEMSRLVGTEDNKIK